MLRRFFVETNADNRVMFVDDSNKAYQITEYDFYREHGVDCTLENAKAADYSGFDGCKTAEECAAAVGMNEEIIEFDTDEYENVIEF